MQALSRAVPIKVIITDGAVTEQWIMTRLHAQLHKKGIRTRDGALIWGECTRCEVSHSRIDPTAVVSEETSVTEIRQCSRIHSIMQRTHCVDITYGLLCNCSPEGAKLAELVRLVALKQKVPGSNLYGHWEKI